jgi:hypothetical protein
MWRHKLRKDHATRSLWRSRGLGHLAVESGVWRAWLVTLVCLIGLISVEPAVSKEPVSLDQARAALTLPEPPEAMSIQAARDLLQKVAGHRATVTVVGRIAARDNEEPFLEGKASFVMLDLPDDAHAADKGHDSANCPFCKRRSAKAALAAVQFVDEKGVVLPFDARRLFGVEKGAKVIVRGEGFFDPKLPFPILQLTAVGFALAPPTAK